MAYVPERERRAVACACVCMSQVCAYGTQIAAGSSLIYKQTNKNKTKQNKTKHKHTERERKRTKREKKKNTEKEVREKKEKEDEESKLKNYADISTVVKSKSLSISLISIPFFLSPFIKYTIQHI